MGLGDTMKNFGEDAANKAKEGIEKLTGGQNEGEGGNKLGGLMDKAKDAAGDAKDAISEKLRGGNDNK
jgi:hypothetical protein